MHTETVQARFIALMIVAAEISFGHSVNSRIRSGHCATLDSCAECDYTPLRLSCVGGSCVRSARRRVLRDLRVRMSSVRMVGLEPFGTLGKHVFLGRFECAVLPLALDEIAGLARGYQIFHVATAPARVGMNMVNSQDKPVLKTLQAIQSAILADEVVALEDFHRFLAWHARGSEEKLLDVMDRHVPPS